MAPLTTAFQVFPSGSLSTRQTTRLTSHARGFAAAPCTNVVRSRGALRVVADDGREQLQKLLDQSPKEPKDDKSAGGGFFAGFSREVEKFFNPQTNGAMIAGRAKGQRNVSEVIRAQEVAEAEFSLESPDLNTFMQWLLDWESGKELGGLGDAAPEELSWIEQRNEQFDIYATPLSAAELALMCVRKYKKFHDMSIKGVNITAGQKRWVALNIYVGHLGQRSNTDTPQLYLKRMEALAEVLNRWNQAGFVRTFFRERPIARRGLPSHPRVDTAVSLRLNRSPTWDDELVANDEFFFEDQQDAASKRI